MERGKEQPKIVLFGTTARTRKLLFQYRAEGAEVIAFADNFSEESEIDGVPVIRPSALSEKTFDEVIIDSFSIRVIREQLEKLGVPKKKIKKSPLIQASEARNHFVESFAKAVYSQGISGNVAEAGVWRGDYAARINAAFPDRKLYLFDTFEGFDPRDLKTENKIDKKISNGGGVTGSHFQNTSVDLVLSKMMAPENCMVCKGYVPESFAGVEDTFCFVNLDMDLYQPTLAALKWFWQRMEKGGVILIHEYFDEEVYSTLKNAVREFSEEVGAPFFPIGDLYSVGFIKS